MTSQTIDLDKGAEQFDKQRDSVVRFLFEDHGVRGEIIHMQTPVIKLLENHKYPKCVESLMLELSAAAVLIAATLKTNGDVTVQIRGDESEQALNFAFINIDKDLNFYGTANLKEGVNYPDDLSFNELVGKNGLLVISAFPEQGARYQSLVPLVEKDLSTNLEEYFKNSEQLPTSIILHHDIHKKFTAGMLLQIIPNIDNNVDSLEHLTTLSHTLTTKELEELSLHECLRRLFWNDKLRVFTPQLVNFKCPCSKARYIKAFQSMPYADVLDLCDDPNGQTLTCLNCNQQYHFTQEELQYILEHHPQAPQTQGEASEEKQAPTFTEDTVINN